jgi:hypothetical protein
MAKNLKDIISKRSGRKVSKDEDEFLATHTVDTKNYSTDKKKKIDEDGVVKIFDPISGGTTTGSHDQWMADQDRKMDREKKAREVTNFNRDMQIDALGRRNQHSDALKKVDKDAADVFDKTTKYQYGRNPGTRSKAFDDQPAKTPDQLRAISATAATGSRKNELARADYEIKQARADREHQSELSARKSKLDREKSGEDTRSTGEKLVGGVKKMFGFNEHANLKDVISKNAGRNVPKGEEDFLAMHTINDRGDVNNNKNVFKADNVKPEAKSQKADPGKRHGYRSVEAAAAAYEETDLKEKTNGVKKKNRLGSEDDRNVDAKDYGYSSGTTSTPVVAETNCNMTSENVMCEVHGLKECWKEDTFYHDKELGEKEKYATIIKKAMGK